MQIRRIAIFGIATRYILSYPVTHLGVETYITHFLDLNTSLVLSYFACSPLVTALKSQVYSTSAYIEILH